MTDPNTPATSDARDGDEPVQPPVDGQPTTPAEPAVAPEDRQPEERQPATQAEPATPAEPAVAPEDRQPEERQPDEVQPATQAEPAVDFGAPAAEQPAAEQPAAEQPAAQQPTAEQPAAERPAPDEPERASDAEPEPLVESDSLAAASVATPEEGTPRTVPPLSPPASQAPTSSPATGPIHDDSALRAAEAARSGDRSDPGVAPAASSATTDEDDLEATRITAAGAAGTGAAAGAATGAGAAPAGATSGAPTSSTAAWTPPPAPESPSEYAPPTEVTTPTPYAPATQAMPPVTSTTPLTNLGSSPAESLGFTDGIAGGDDGFTPEELAQRRQFRDEMTFRQKQEFGGINFGAGFFGWLAAVGLAGILYVVVGGVAAVSGFAKPEVLTGGATRIESFGSQISAQTLQVSGLVVFLVVLFLSYFVGGFVASRMARFSRLKQGLAVWLWGVFMSVITAVVVIVVASQSTTVSTLQDQMGPIDPASFITPEALIGEGLIIVLSIGGALLGGLAGGVFHRRVDRFALEEV